ncbi:MAG: transposase [Chroococcidiopsidaceae cyanobacterium CP_BM_RX_35]|nr:transposase [Chroococcidiopsidaceae cyanobacterium CP_BM_RX_35]
MRTFLRLIIPVLINLQTLIDEQKCYETVRQLRWSEGVTCSKCNSLHVVKRGFDETQPYRQRYQCQACRSRFDDLRRFLRKELPLMPVG